MWDTLRQWSNERIKPVSNPKAQAKKVKEEIVELLDEVIGEGVGDVSLLRMELVEDAIGDILIAYNSWLVVWESPIAMEVMLPLSITKALGHPAPTGDIGDVLDKYYTLVTQNPRDDVDYLEDMILFIMAAVRFFGSTSPLSTYEDVNTILVGAIRGAYEEIKNRTYQDAFTKW